MFIDHCYYQIVWRKARNLELCFRTNVGTNQARIEKISISWAILLWCLCSLVSAMRCKAIRSNGGAKRDPLAHAPSKYWGTCGGTRAVSRCWVARLAAAANARAEVRARMHNWSVRCQGSSHTIGCAMAHSKTRPARGEPTEQISMSGGEILDSSVESARFLAFIR